MAELTGTRVRETVPDSVIAVADEIVLVDLTPEALIARLQAGKVYPQERVAAALNHFFRIENLSALREVALREVAEEVETKRRVSPLAGARRSARARTTQPAAPPRRSRSACSPSSRPTRSPSASSAAPRAPRSGSTASSTSSTSGPTSGSRAPRSASSSRRCAASPPCSARTS